MTETREQNVLRFDRGVFTLSLDLELIWGTVDLFGPDGFSKACEVERAVVIDRLLDLFVEYRVLATWFVVGHLMLERCEETEGRKHPEIVRSQQSWKGEDWFHYDPCGDERSAPNFLGRSLIEKIRACPVEQEIGCHSFSHALFDEGCLRETAESELAACVRAASEMGIEMRSFAFPRNRVGHLDLLRRYGFTVYRGPDPVRLEGRLPNALRRIANLLNVLRAAEPPVVLPVRTDEGLWNTPGSMVYFPMHGLRRYIPNRLRIKRAVKGLRRAARDKRIFHLWFHPTNFAFETEKMFAGLRAILDEASKLRERGELSFLPVGQLVPVNSEFISAGV